MFEGFFKRLHLHSRQDCSNSWLLLCVSIQQKHGLFCLWREHGDNLTLWMGVKTNHHSIQSLFNHVNITSTPSTMNIGTVYQPAHRVQTAQDNRYYCQCKRDLWEWNFWQQLIKQSSIEKHFKKQGTKQRLACPGSVFINRWPHKKKCKGILSFNIYLFIEKWHMSCFSVHLTSYLASFKTWWEQNDFLLWFNMYNLRSNNWCTFVLPWLEIKTWMSQLWALQHEAQWHIWK